jgi:hypothetical protein
MAGEIHAFLHIVRVDTPVDPVNAEYRIAFAPLGGRLRGRHVRRQGLDSLTDFLGRRGSPSRRSSGPGGRSRSAASTPFRVSS